MTTNQLPEDRLPDPIVETGQATVHGFFIRRGGRIYGHAFLHEIPIWEDGSYTGRRNGDVQEVWVHGDYREKGYGQDMMERLVKEARRLGMENVYLTSRKHREAARHIYEKLGFVITTDGFTLKLVEPKKEEEETSE